MADSADFPGRSGGSAPRNGSVPQDPSASRNGAFASGGSSPQGETSSPGGSSPAGETPGSGACCHSCGRPLTGDECALTRKLINRGTDRFFCLSCLAARFQVSEDILREKIAQFRAMGCTLFS